MLGALVVSLFAGVVNGCNRLSLTNQQPTPCCGSSWSIPQSTKRDVDILFVIDNAGMSNENATMRAQLVALITSLRNMESELPNVHLGVTSTDLGAGPYGITYCEEAGGDAGALLTGNCANPSGGTGYIVDVEPRACEISWEPDNTCSAHTCSQANCAHEPTANYVQDDQTGCPRCRNYNGESLGDVLSCVAGLGTMGCGFEQPLEAMYKALDNNPANVGFIRDNALLTVILVTNEDDCSASNPQLFDNAQTDVNSTLGPLTSYRCFEFGVTCDINSRTHQGARQNCVPREDAAALLHPISRYVQFLQELKDPQMVVLAAIAGPITPSPTGAGYNMDVDLDDMGYPNLQYSCTTAVDGAVPTMRIHNLISTFNEEEDLASWAYSSICSADHMPALAGIGNRIKDALGFPCLPAPLKGCADPGVEFGTPRAAQTCAINGQCLATCEVTDVLARGTPDEVQNTVPPCLEILQDGTRSRDNANRSRAFANGHPNERDASLPVEACWHINYQENCPSSNYAEIIISRRSDPPSRTFSLVACQQLAQGEQLCNDGRDNDENCLADQDDPCCNNPSQCD